MNRKKLFILSLLVLINPIQMLSVENDIQHDFLSIAIDDKNAYAFAKECMSTISEDSIKEPEKNKISVIRPADKTKPYLSITNKKIYCINMSKNQNPILPLNVFENTIDFPDMEKDEIIKLRTDLSKQLAITGSATAIVVNEKGNANVLTYLFAHETPIKFFYHASFLKNGEFNEKTFPIVYRAKGGMSITARGQSPEYSKLFF